MGVSRQVWIDAKTRCDWGKRTWEKQEQDSLSLFLSSFFFTTLSSFFFSSLLVYSGFGGVLFLFDFCVFLPRTV